MRSVPQLGSIESGNQRGEDLALPTKLHLLLPILLNLPFAKGTVNKPAKIASLELPGRTFFSHLQRATPFVPTGLATCVRETLEIQKKQQLPFGVCRDVSPSLFEALYRFGRDTQQSSYLRLGFAQMATNLRKFGAIH